MRLTKHISSLLLILVLVVAFTGCDPSRHNEAVDPIEVIPQTGTKSVQIVVSPGIIPADGVSAALITAYCRVDGQNALDNLPVTFRTDKGTFSLNSVEAQTGSSATYLSRSTKDGYAQIYLLSEAEQGVANITVTFAGDVSNTATVEFGKVEKQLASIELKGDPATGNSPLNSVITATLKDADSKPVDGVAVRFRINDAGATFAPQKVKSDINGKAQTNLSNVTKDCIVTVTAQDKTAQLPISINNDVVTGFTLKILNQPTGFTGLAFINSGYNLLLQATVTGSGGGLVNQNVTFSSTDSGVNFTRNPVVTDSSGVAETWAQNNTRDALITARTGGKSATLTVKINRGPYAEIFKVSGEPLAGGVVKIVLSGENSYDPDEGYGDSIQAYSWRYEWDGTCPLTSSTSSSPPSINLTFGDDDTTSYPADGDECRVFLQVEDKLGLRYTTMYTITFTS